MNIKSSINLIRGILYLHEIIRCKSISRAAEENNMKASNLGIIINDLEKQTGTKLLKRTHLGSSPTAEGLRVAQYAVELEEQIQKIRQWHENTHPRNRTLNIYIAPNMELDDCRDFEVQHPDIKLNFIDEDILADVKVNNQPPADPGVSSEQTTSIFTSGYLAINSDKQFERYPVPKPSLVHRRIFPETFLSEIVKFLTL